MSSPGESATVKWFPYVSYDGELHVKSFSVKPWGNGWQIIGPDGPTSPSAPHPIKRFSRDQAFDSFEAAKQRLVTTVEEEIDRLQKRHDKLRTKLIDTLNRAEAF